MAAYLTRSRPSFAGLRSRAALFLNQRGGRLTRQGTSLILSRAAKGAGIRSKVTPHAAALVRHPPARRATRVVQELLGHASVTTTQIYTLVTGDRLREEYFTAHPRARRADRRGA